jgi:hypothetical protein
MKFSELVYWDVDLNGFRLYENFSFQETSNIGRIEVLTGPASVQYIKSPHPRLHSPQTRVNTIFEQ